MLVERSDCTQTILKGMESQAIPILVCEKISRQKYSRIVFNLSPKTQVSLTTAQWKIAQSGYDGEYEYAMLDMQLFLRLRLGRHPIKNSGASHSSREMNFFELYSRIEYNLISEICAVKCRPLLHLYHHEIDIFPNRVVNCRCLITVATFSAIHTSTFH